MAGHSKWNNIRHKKGKTDAQRAKVFTKLSREIIVAVKAGGPDPSANSRLKDVLAKARAANVPNDNIKRVIAKASGAGDNTTYEAITYEGYGPGGVAMIVETLTDNRVRTVAEVRCYFDKYGGNMGAPNSVAWSFDHKGVLVIDKVSLKSNAHLTAANGKAPPDSAIDEEELTLTALDAGADDIEALEDVYHITTTPEHFGDVHTALEADGYSFINAQVELVPQTTVTITDDDMKQFIKLLDVLDDNDDISNVYHNCDNV